MTSHVTTPVAFARSCEVAPQKYMHSSHPDSLFTNKERHLFPPDGSLWLSQLESTKFMCFLCSLKIVVFRSRLSCSQGWKTNRFDSKTLLQIELNNNQQSVKYNTKENNNFLWWPCDLYNSITAIRKIKTTSDLGSDFSYNHVSPGCPKLHVGYTALQERVTGSSNDAKIYDCITKRECCLDLQGRGARIRLIFYLKWEGSSFKLYADLL